MSLIPISEKDRLLENENAKYLSILRCFTSLTNITSFPEIKGIYYFKNYNGYYY